MDLELKYLEAETKCDIYDWFYDRLSEYSIEDASTIIGSTVTILDDLPYSEGWSQEISGVIKKEDPIFFVVEYVKQENEMPSLVDVYEIEMDEYLDYIKKNQTINYYESNRNVKPKAEQD